MRKYTLDYVCRNLLDNADYVFDIKAFPHLIFKFCVFGQVDGKFWQVVLDCRNIVNFQIANLDKDWDTQFINICLGINIEKKEAHGDNSKYIYEITIEGDLYLKFEVLHFSWELKELTFEESIALRKSWGIEN